MIMYVDIAEVLTRSHVGPSCRACTDGWPGSLVPSAADRTVGAPDNPPEPPARL